MLSQFNELLVTTASDGASVSADFYANSNTADMSLLMDAWCQERQQRIEVGFLLDEAKRLLTRINKDGIITAKSQRKVRRLLHVIKKANAAQEPRDL